MVADVAGDDDAYRLAPGGLHRSGDDAEIAATQRQANRRLADAGGRGDQTGGRPIRRPAENRPFFAVNRNHHAMLADQRIAEPGGQRFGRAFPGADVAHQHQLAEQFVGIEFGHVGVGRAAQINAQRREDQRRQQREGERQAQRDRMAPARHGQRISIT